MSTSGGSFEFKLGFAHLDWRQLDAFFRCFFGTFDWFIRPKNVSMPLIVFIVDFVSVKGLAVDVVSFNFVFFSVWLVA